MTEQTARRIILVLIQKECFRDVLCAAHDARNGNAVLDDPGFTLAEIDQAAHDRSVISVNYSELKKDHSFMGSEIIARLRFLIGLEE